MTTDRSSDSLLRIADVRRRTGLSTATVYRRVQAKTFPPKVQIGPAAVAWYKSDIDAFVANPLTYRAA
ncbi:helix-turn-helix transcriptional regulator [Sphingomonas sp. Leaf17]|uniref:helix-turn-helix transcriptional regulator n=1 Tax=Sphingomonas sp. Leaf17 TaxID=1735683 RepID=UPI001F1FD96F|nr:AlpA family phage regulatory protein [Sphingomonas sp. Leaf17]